MTPKEQARERRLLAKYNITLADYDKILAAQDGVCAGCKRPPSAFKLPLSVDHDHSTRKIRGLLCWSENRLLPCRKNLLEVLKNLVDYLSAPPAERAIGERFANPLKRKRRKK